MVMTRFDDAAGVVMVWQRLATNVVHRSQWFEVRADSVVRPDGGHGTYTHVVAPASVTVLAIQDDDHVVLTRQWIYTHGGTEWRLPGGAIDDGDADPVAAARRELEEETGLRAQRWERLGQIHGADSLSNHVDHIFLATGLTQGEPSLEPAEADLCVRTMPFCRALDLVRQGMLPHAGSSHALLVMALRRTQK
ncbi:ADP-ribose pyrophosphatase [Lentzea pudingi]|uniref:ADP-ribose pyrophosphatase n=1 Tax=Lentzea pudingi TaxID=1789439 RepID=A0ABQ2IAW7_9PSEU|nr:NUDIX hydrolase [Lentzea pudingi]GGN02948.1 ADP-ribose pyrophosphatase [Lentzea pudingi]